MSGFEPPTIDGKNVGVIAKYCATATAEVFRMHGYHVAVAVIGVHDGERPFAKGVWVEDVDRAPAAAPPRSAA